MIWAVSIAGRGGKRDGAGRRKNQPEVLPHVDKKIASQILDLRERPKHDKDCACELCAGWHFLNEVQDVRLRWEARKYYTDKRDGKAVHTVNHLHDKPLEMNVNVKLSEIIRQVRERKREYERNRG